MNATMQVQIKQVYGEDKIYPVSENAKIVCMMLTQKTLTYSNVDHLKRLGFTIEVVTNTPSKL